MPFQSLCAKYECLQTMPNNDPCIIPDDFPLHAFNDEGSTDRSRAMPSMGGLDRTVENDSNNASRMRQTAGEGMRAIRKSETFASGGPFVLWRSLDASVEEETGRPTFHFCHIKNRSQPLDYCHQIGYNILHLALTRLWLQRIVDESQSFRIECRGDPKQDHGHSAATSNSKRYEASRAGPVTVPPVLAAWVFNEA